MKVLIVDDEWPARRELRGQLEKFRGVQVVGEAASAPEALELIQAVPYDVVFLDIQMPGTSGLELARRLQQQPGRPHVVFTTAYPQYAIDAVNLGAAGYLLKPFDEQMLTSVLRRVMGMRTTPAEADSFASRSPGRAPAPRSERVPEPFVRIPVEKRGKILLVSPSEIVYAAANDDRTFVKVGSDCLACRFTLKELEDKLAPFGFLKVHRRFLVNLEKVREVVSYFKGSIALVTADAERSEIPVSRALAPLVRERLGLRALTRR